MGALANDDDGYREYSTLVVCPGVFGVADDLVNRVFFNFVWRLLGYGVP